MQSTKIEWCDFVWNPVTGCKHDCKYCYARPRALMSQKSPNPKIAYKYRNGFYPTFHPELLTVPAKRKKPTRVFVCSMADLFGRWVPDSWIEQVFQACEAAPQHTYFFLTKNPGRYDYFSNFPPYCFLGKTSTGKLREDSIMGADYTASPCGPNETKKFISVEPMLGPIRLLFSARNFVDWIIVGGQTRPTVLPKKEWVLDLKKQCEDNDIPIFMKNNLAGLGIELVQQFPKPQ